MMTLSTMKKIVDSLDENWKSPVADEIAARWKADKGSVDYIRSSANFVFTFQRGGKRFFLRFNSISERSKEEIAAEIEILNTLNEQSDVIARPVLSSNDQFVEELQTVNDSYLAVVFEGFGGKMYEIEELGPEKFFLWGKALGHLHKLFDEIPEHLLIKRKSRRDHVNFIEGHLPGTEKAAQKELETIEHLYEKIEEKKGLIHFDFELDNLIWDGERINIIDFDDAAVYGYGADLAFALRDLFEGSIDTHNPLFNQFIEGYATEFKYDDNLFDNLPLYLRFHNLLTFTKLVRSLDYTVEASTPNWLKGLHAKLTRVVDQYRESFGSYQ